jgi:hypothetical protein
MQTDFGIGRQRCSNCGTLIASNSESCDNCGQSFWDEGALQYARPTNKQHTKPSRPKDKKYTRPASHPTQPKQNETNPQIAALIREIAELQHNSSKLTSENQTLKEQLRLANERGGNDKFARVKRAFAQKFHPDSVEADGIEKVVKNEIFKEFWEEIRKIDSD